MSKAFKETANHVSNQLLVNTIKERSWNEACEIVYNDSSYAKILDLNGYPPIHLAVKLGCTCDLVVLLLRAYPESILIRDPDGNLPIHLVSYHHKDRLWVNISEIASILYVANNASIKMLDKIGNLPIHIAIRYRAPDELIKFLLLQYPESAKIPDSIYGNLLLHLSIQFHASYEVISLILETYYDAVKVKNNKGSLPLHKAIQFDSTMDVFKLLLNTDLSAANVPDNNGNLPLHIMFLFGTGPPNEERLRLLLSSNPTAVGTMNNQGNIPFMMMNRPQDHYVEDYK